jgi:hypothetical protein
MEPRFHYATIAMKSGFGHQVVVSREEASGVEGVYAFIKDAILEGKPLKLYAMDGHVYPSVSQVEAITIK